MIDRNFGNVSAGVLFSIVAYQRKQWYNIFKLHKSNKNFPWEGWEIEKCKNTQASAWYNITHKVSCNMSEIQCKPKRNREEC